MKHRLPLLILALSSFACQVSPVRIAGLDTSRSTAASSSRAPAAGPSSSSETRRADVGPSAVESKSAPAVPDAKANRGAALRALSVVVKHPELRPEDSFDLDKVAAAFAVIDRASIVVTKTKDMVVWRPSPHEKSVDQDRTRGGKCGTDGLEAFGSNYLRESSGFGSISLEYDLCPLDYEHVPAGTAGVVWSTEPKQDGRQTDIVFVTLDGGRYVLEDYDWEEPAVVAEVPPVSSWPTAPLHSFLGPREISRLADDRSKAANTAIEAAKKSWDACMSPVLDREEAEYRANNASSVTESARRAKNQQTAEKFKKLRDSSCGKKKKDYSDALLRYLKDRAKARAAILEANKQRFGG